LRRLCVEAVVAAPRAVVSGLWECQTSKQGKEPMAAELGPVAPLAGLEPATCCLGGVCRLVRAAARDSR
jgi:hypothetical protein